MTSSREIAAEVFGLALVEDAAIWDSICARLSRRGIPVAERNRRQAQVPAGATVLPNANGTAPGLYLQKGGRHLFLLPGPPSELRPMFLEPGACPFCAAWCRAAPRWSGGISCLIGMGESNVEAAVGEDLLAIPGPGTRLLRAARARWRCGASAGRRRWRGRRKFCGRSFPGNLAAAGRDTLEKTVVDRLAALGQTLATAESCTGGMLANRLTNVPGSSAVFHFRAL